MNQQEIEALAIGGMIVSDSMMDHFRIIVASMDAIGAHRRGSKTMRDNSGRRLILDEYVLPNGKTILAGYENPFA